MQEKQYLEAGRIASTHGVHGALLIKPWCDGPEVICGLKTLYIDGKPVGIRSASVHKSMALCRLEGVDDMNAAIPLKGKVVFLDRAEVPLEEGRHFVQDLIGLRVIDAAEGEIGTLREVLHLPASDVYVVEGEKRYMIPVVDAFVEAVDLEQGEIRVRLIEGMGDEI